MARPSQAPRTKQVITLLAPEDFEPYEILVLANRSNISEYTRNLILEHMREEGVYVLSHVKQMEGQMGLFEEDR